MANRDQPAWFPLFHQRKCLKEGNTIGLEVLVSNLILLWVFVYDDYDTCFVCLLAEKAINKVCFLFAFSTETWRSWTLAKMRYFIFYQTLVFLQRSQFTIQNLEQYLFLLPPSTKFIFISGYFQSTQGI